MRMRPHFRLLLICWLSAVLIGGCGPRRQTAAYRLAVVPKGTTHMHWQSVHAGAKKAAEEAGDVEIIWEGPDTEANQQEQQNIVQRFTAEGVDALVLAPIDRQTLLPAVKAALKKDMAVVIIDSGLEADPEIEGHPKYLGYVATDNREGGRQAGEYMAGLLKGKEKAKVLLVPYQAGSESTEQREAGFRDEIRKHKNIELIIANEEAGATVDTAHKASERLLINYPELDGIFMPNESSTVGMLQALRALKRVGEARFVGFDGSDILIAALKAGEIDGLVLQDPFDMGYQSTRRAIQFLRGIPPETKTLHTSSRVATRANVADPIIRQMYAPNSGE